MTKCPKCGSYRIFGPKYESRACGKWGEAEGLRYTCFECGYSETRPTLDATGRAAPPAKGTQQE